MYVQSMTLCYMTKKEAHILDLTADSCMVEARHRLTTHTRTFMF